MCYTVKRRDLVENVQLVRNALESSWFPSFPSSPFHSVPLSGLTALSFSFFLPSCCVVSPPPRFLSLPLSVQRREDGLAIWAGSEYANGITSGVMVMM